MSSAVILTGRNPIRAKPPLTRPPSSPIPPPIHHHRHPITPNDTRQDASLLVDDDGPDDEMNPSHNDTDGCNMLSPLYNLQGLCGVRQRQSQYEKEALEDGLDDGELPALSPRIVSPEAKSQKEEEVREGKKANRFWSQLELDLEEDDDEEEEEEIPRNIATRSPKLSPKRSRSTMEYRIDDHDEDGPSALNELCTMAQTFSHDLLTSICGGGGGGKTPTTQSSKPYTNHIYATSHTPTQEQVAIEVEYLEEDDGSNGSLEEVDELEDDRTAVGSFLQLDVTEGDVTRMATRAKSPTRVVITNLPNDLEQREREIKVKEVVAPPPSHLNGDPVDEVEEEEEDEEDDYDPHHLELHPVVLPETASVSSSISQTSRNSMLSNFSRASKKSFRRQFSKSKPSTHSPPSHHSEEGSAQELALPNWSPSKQEQYDQFREQGHPPSEALLLVNENENDPHRGEVSDLETSDVEDSTSRLSRKKRTRSVSGTTSDTGSVSSSTSSISSKLKNFLKAKKQSKIHRTKEDSKTYQPSYSSSSSSSSSEGAVEPITISQTQSMTNRPSRKSISPSGRNRFLKSFQRRSQSRSQSRTRVNSPNSSHNPTRPQSADPRARHDHSSSSTTPHPPTLIAKRSASAPRGGRQPRSRKASLLSSRSRPIPGIDDLLQSSLSWDLPSPPPEDDSDDDSIFEDLESSRRDDGIEADVTMEISNTTSQNANATKGPTTTSSIDDLLGADVVPPAFTPVAPPTPERASSEPTDDRSVEASTTISTSRGAALRRRRLATRERATTSSTPSMVEQHRASETSEEGPEEESSSSLLSLSNETPKDQLWQMNKSLSPIPVRTSYQEDDEEEEEEDDRAEHSVEETDDTPYVSVDLDERSLLSYGSISVASPRKQDNPPSPSHDTVSSPFSDYNDDATLATTQSMGLTARDRRMERAKHRNPWLRDSHASSEVLPPVSSSSEEEEKPSLLHSNSNGKTAMPISNLRNQPRSPNVSLGTYLDTDKHTHTQKYGIDSETMSVAETLGARSVLTTATDATWKRRNGTSKDRLAQVHQRKSHEGQTQGWLESMKQAASDGKVPYHTWDPVQGWVVIPGMEERVKDTQSPKDVEPRTMEVRMEAESLMEGDEESASSAEGEDPTDNVKQSLLSKEKIKSDGTKHKPLLRLARATSKQGNETHQLQPLISQRPDVHPESMSLPAPSHDSPIIAPAKDAPSLPSPTSNDTTESISPIPQKKLFDPEILKLHQNPRDRNRTRNHRRKNFDDASSVISEDTEHRLQQCSSVIRNGPGSNLAPTKKMSAKMNPSPQSVIPLDESGNSSNEVNQSTKMLFDTYFSHSGDETGDSKDDSQALSGEESEEVTEMEEKLSTVTTTVEVVKQKISVEESRLFASSPTKSSTSNERWEKSSSQPSPTRGHRSDVSDVHGRGMSRLATIKSARVSQQQHSQTSDGSSDSEASDTKFLQSRLEAIKKMRSDMKNDSDRSDLKQRIHRLKTAPSMDSETSSSVLEVNERKKPNTKRSVPTNSETSGRSAITLKPSISDTKLKESQLRRERTSKQDVFRSKPISRNASRLSSESKSDIGARSSATSAVSSLISKYNSGSKKVPEKKRTPRRASSTGRSDVSVEEEGLFLDALARTYTDDEDYRSDVIARPVPDRKEPTISEKVELGNNLVFEQAHHTVDTHSDRDFSSDVYSSQRQLSRQTSEVTESRFSEVESDTGAGACTGGFFSRMAACNAGPSIGTSDLPLSHLAFMMKGSKQSSMESVTVKEQEEEDYPAPPTPVVHRTRGTSPESSITFKKSLNVRKPPRSETSKSITSPHYLETIAKKAAASGFKNVRNRPAKDAESSSQVSQTSSRSSSSEAWQSFMAKKKLGGIDTPKVAEQYAAGKVEEMMSAMSKSTSDVGKKKTASDIIESLSNAGSSNITSKDAQRFLVQRDRKSMKQAIRSRSASKARPEYAEAAEKLAAARVEAMMSALSGSGTKRGSEI